MSSGAFVIQVKGAKRWTAVRSTLPMYYGESYGRTKDEARANAEVNIASCRRSRPNREFRIGGGDMLVRR